MVNIETVLKDEPVRREVAAYIGEGRPLPKGEQWSVTPEMVQKVLDARPATDGDRNTRPYTEAVIREFGRPVLLIRNSKIEIPRSLEMRNRLLPARGRLEAQLPSVGRIELVGHPERRSGGTGWVIADRVPIKVIEQKAGLSFGTLRNRDPARGQEEAAPAQLTSLSQIRF